MAVTDTQKQRKDPPLIVCPDGNVEDGDTTRHVNRIMGFAEFAPSLRFVPERIEDMRKFNNDLGAVLRKNPNRRTVLLFILTSENRSSTMDQLTRARLRGFNAGPFNRKRCILVVQDPEAASQLTEGMVMSADSGTDEITDYFLICTPSGVQKEEYLETIGDRLRLFEAGEELPPFELPTIAPPPPGPPVAATYGRQYVPNPTLTHRPPAAATLPTARRPDGTRYSMASQPDMAPDDPVVEVSGGIPSAGSSHPPPRESGSLPIAREEPVKRGGSDKR